jgi:hypothetical protein
MKRFQFYPQHSPLSMTCTFRLESEFWLVLGSTVAAKNIPEPDLDIAYAASYPGKSLWAILKRNTN